MPTSDKYEDRGAPVTMATHKKSVQRNTAVVILIQSAQSKAVGISQRQVGLLLSASARFEAY